MRYCFLILIYIVCLPSAAIELPDIGLSANTVMSPADEQKLGKTFLRQIRREMDIIDDLQISNYFNDLGHHLASYSNAPAQHFYFFTIEESSLNAFAVPGGFIGINSGLILKTRSESELASVLAHEISHVTQRHIARTIEASERYSLPTIAAIIAAVLIAGASNSSQVGEAAVAAVMAGNVQMQINFTRTHEKEADRIGMQILAKAGFEPRDMANVFERFYVANRFYQSVPEFLRTHPVTTDRIAEARSRAQKYDRQPLSDTPLYHLMKAKLLTLITDDKQKLLKQLKEMLKTGRYRDERATRYALALTLLENKQTRGVQTQIDWLLKNDSDRVVYRLLQAQLMLLEEKEQKAMQIYEYALQIYPGDKMLGLDYAEKLLQNNVPKKAKTILLELKDFNNPYYYRLLARAYQKTGKKPQAHLALAEHYYLMGDTRLAIEQLELAYKTDKIDFYLASRIDARLEEMQGELLELHKASKER